jgi:cyclic pyranopterin phosphate synthase
MSHPLLRYLRISVTSRCNLACIYCRPGKSRACSFVAERGPCPPSADEGDDLLTAEEIACFVRLAVECGIEKVRVTGGEPLMRPDIVEIVRDLARLPGLADLGMTTNATLLAPLARSLRKAGLRRINIGLSAITPTVYEQITRGGKVEDALAGLHAALDAGLDPVKVNVVLMRGVNEGEIAALAELTRDRSLEVRFVEFMPFQPPASLPKVPHSREPSGGCSDRIVPAAEVLARLRELGDPEPLPGRRGPASAQRFRIRGYQGAIGIIAPHTEPFCQACDRVRLTADGKLRACLIEGGEQDILPLIRAGLDRPTMERLLATSAAMKPDRHAGSFRGQMHRIGG